MTPHPSEASTSPENRHHVLVTAEERHPDDVFCASCGADRPPPGSACPGPPGPSYAAPRREQGPSRADPADPLPDPDAEAHQVSSVLRDADLAVGRGPGPAEPYVWVRMVVGEGLTRGGWMSAPMRRWNADWLVGRLRKLYPDAEIEVVE